jgi:hypothetical protein
MVGDNPVANDAQTNKHQGCGATADDPTLYQLALFLVLHGCHEVVPGIIQARYSIIGWLHVPALDQTKAMLNSGNGCRVECYALGIGRVL